MHSLFRRKKVNSHPYQSFQPSPLGHDPTHRPQQSTPNLPLRSPHRLAQVHVKPVKGADGPLNSNPVTLADLAYVAYLQERSGVPKSEQQQEFVSSHVLTRSTSILNERVKTISHLEGSALSEASFQPPLPEFVSDLQKTLCNTGSIESFKVMNSAASEARERRLRGPKSLPVLNGNAESPNTNMPPVSERHILWADPSGSGGYEVVEVGTAKVRRPSFGILNGVASTPRVLKRRDEL